MDVVNGAWNFVSGDICFVLVALSLKRHGNK